MTHEDASIPALEIRALDERDSIAELTELLHRSYRRLAEMGLRFYATHQTEEQTRERVDSGRCFVGIADGRTVATITLYHSRDRTGPELYRQEGVAYFGQFAVEPESQGRGYGNMMLEHIETVARADGIRQLALDTAETATHLIEYYSRHGYDIVDHVQWDLTNYRSVVMSKSL